MQSIANRVVGAAMMGLGLFVGGIASAGLLQDIFQPKPAPAPVKELADLPAGRSSYDYVDRNGYRHWRGSSGGRRHFSRQAHVFHAQPRRRRVALREPEMPIDHATPRGDPLPRPTHPCDNTIVYAPIEEIEQLQNADMKRRLDADDVKHGQPPTWTGTIPAFKPSTSER